MTLRGSRATATHGEDSDWDFGLYYRGTINPDDVRALGWPGPAFAPQLRRTAPPRWYRLAAGALEVGRVHASRGDRISALANFTQALLATAQGRLAAAGVWALNEKRLVERADLDTAQGLLDGVDVQ